MKKHRLLFVLPMTILLLALLTWGLARDTIVAQRALENRIQLILDGRSGQEIINLWQYEEEPEYYFFLPAYAKTDALRLMAEGYPSIEIDGQTCRSGELLPDLKPDTLHTIRFGAREGSLTVMQTDPLPSMYITTRTGGTEKIHEHKGAKENVNLLYLDETGAEIYAQEKFKDKINVRGNTSSNLAKKPYTLTLDQKADLLDCGEATKWVLIANATDATNLRDKIVYDFACELGMPYAPNCGFVSVYINGVYEGLYLLSEKTEVAPNRVELETERGYLVAANQSTKWDSMSNGFATRYHEYEIVKSKKVAPQIRDEIASQFKRIESLMTDGNEEALLPLIDLDSWARRYLVDEVFCNPDAEKASTYYYWHDLSSDGPLYAGPIWDYDYALSNKGRYRDAASLLIGNVKEYPLYAAMMRLPAFRQMAEQQFNSEFLPLAREYAEQRIPTMYQSLRKTIRINNLMWADQCRRLQYDADSEVQQLCSFLSAHLDFMSDWLAHPDDYCFVNFAQEEEFFNMSYALKRGDSLGGHVDDWVHLPELYESWYDSDTGEVFDVNRPVTEDVTVYPKLKHEAKTEKNDEKLMKYAPVIVLLGMLGVAGLAMFVIVVQQIIREGGRRKH